MSGASHGKHISNTPMEYSYILASCTDHDNLYLQFAQVAVLAGLLYLMLSAAGRPS
jgi:hypothetical protein